uniref:Uncharacterized protein LOC114326951 isoform X1 n=1 Tax=Diabrotica virgifera virgifera TaxID=50390 RepID=A0A6P7F6W8_DIAVI
MKIYFILLIVAITFFEVQAWVGTLRSDPGTEHLGDCYSSSEGVGAMKFGEEKRLEGECVQLVCSKNRDIQEIGCGSVGIAPPCKIMPGDLSKPYPDCCYEISCPETIPLPKGKA